MEEMNREATTFFLEQMGELGDDHRSAESGSSDGDQTSTCVLNPGNATPVCETSMWEEWTQGTSTGVDEVSTSNFLPELTPSTTSRLSCQQSDMLASWMSTFHPLTSSYLNPVDLMPSTTAVDVATSFMHEPGLVRDPSDLETVDPAHSFPLAYENSKVATGASAVRQMRRGSALGPLSPSSPLAGQNGLQKPLGNPWDSCPTMQWSTMTSSSGQSHHSNSIYGHRATGSSSTTATITTATTVTPATLTSFIPDHSSTAINHLESIATATRIGSLPRPRHTDIFIGPNGTFESSTPGGWTPQSMYDSAGMGSSVESSVTPMKMMASFPDGETTSSDVCAESKLNGFSEIGLVPRDDADRVRQVGISAPSARQGCNAVSVSGILVDRNRPGANSSSLTAQGVWPGKHRLELVELVDGEEVKSSSQMALLKRPKTNPSVEHTNALQWSDQTLRGAELRSYCSGGISNCSSLAASHAMEIIAIGPALNTNGKPRARRGSATDPQSVYARHRREKINERFKNLQKLVPNGAKVDIVTMLEEAINYVKFLQHQLELLQSEDTWMSATPNNYNGMDLSTMCPHSQELESSA